MGCGIYAIKNISNGKMYIGYSKNIKKRLSEHLSRLHTGKHINKYLQNSFNKYGEKSFVFEVICECEIEELKSLEKYYISMYNTLIPNGYNLTMGGDGNVGWHPPLSSINKSKKAVILLNDLSCYNSVNDVARIFGLDQGSVSACCSGRRNYTGEINNTPLVWMFLSDYNEIENKDIYVKTKLYNAQNTKTKKSVIKNKKPVICVNNGKVFTSMSDAAKWAGLKNTTSIMDVVNGKYKTAGKDKITKERLIWRYAFANEHNYAM